MNTSDPLILCFSSKQDPFLEIQILQFRSERFHIFHRFRCSSCSPTFCYADIINHRAPRTQQTETSCQSRVRKIPFLKQQWFTFVEVRHKCSNLISFAPNYVCIIFDKQNATTRTRCAPEIQSVVVSAATALCTRSARSDVSVKPN